MTDLKLLVEVADNAGTKYLCGCKRTSSPPCRDGSHARLTMIVARAGSMNARPPAQSFLFRDPAMPFSSTARASAARHLRRPLRMALTAAFVTTLAACSSMDLGLGKAEPPPPCPTVRLDRDTVQAVQYVGPGRDITDMAFTIELQGYGGNCQYEDEHVIVQVVPQFVIERGPAGARGNIRRSVRLFRGDPQLLPEPGRQASLSPPVPVR